ncbi:glycosyltransferase [Pseudoalteromonas sp. NGC95]|uniref:glycosyltransferase n=1 Tax=Pseudoalteromonas sp. NGC95 TaxID=2792051 RepID=UPI0018CF5707|nr:glycosyltransferase [Pseudoalteromonas sp. NGC95]MBH0015100.1 glycosyltransferase [Pseudoalteromonas sp. NGC95]
MNRVFINATSAKKGGALTILNSYCSAKKNDNDNFYIIFSPLKPNEPPLNCRWIKYETKGFFSLMFNIFLSWFYCQWHRCDKIISFSNVNTIFHVNKKVTYFHNVLILNPKSFKYKVLNFILHYFRNDSELFIFQTPYVKKMFAKTFGNLYSYEICWPGFCPVLPSQFDALKVSRLKLSGNNKVLVPICNIEEKHKNFDLVVSLASANPDIQFNVTCAELVLDIYPNIIFIGELTRHDFIEAIRQSDCVLITSTLETVCLPIFEAIQLNIPALVFKSDYLLGIYEVFGELNGVFQFDSVDNFFDRFVSATKYEFDHKKCKKYLIGNWDF